MGENFKLEKQRRAVLAEEQSRRNMNAVAAEIQRKKRIAGEQGK